MNIKKLIPSFIKQSVKDLLSITRLEQSVSQKLSELKTLEQSLEEQIQHKRAVDSNVEPLYLDIKDIKAKLVSIEHDLTMPKYFYHSPLDYSPESHSPSYGQSIIIEGEPLPIPPPECRPGYAPDNDQLYLEWGHSDRNFILDIIKKHYDFKSGIEILDFGCSSGRVLRHFYEEMKEHNWKLHGVDIQAFLVEWMRRNFPPEINVLCGSTFPHLPLKDSSIDVIYGISVFTHTKYLWDMWLSEFKRVLKPGGLCIQTIQCETAWRFYHENREIDWIKQGHPWSMLEKPEIDEDFFFYGDGFISQIFYQKAGSKAPSFQDGFS